MMRDEALALATEAPTSPAPQVESALPGASRYLADLADRRDGYPFDAFEDDLDDGLPRTWPIDDEAEFVGQRVPESLDASSGGEP